MISCFDLRCADGANQLVWNAVSQYTCQGTAQGCQGAASVSADLNGTYPKVYNWYWEDLTQGREWQRTLERELFSELLLTVQDRNEIPMYTSSSGMARGEKGP